MIYYDEIKYMLILKKNNIIAYIEYM